MRKLWCHNHKTWTSDNLKCVRDVVRWVVLHTVPYIRKSLHLENTQESQQTRMPDSNSGTWGRFCDGLDSNTVVYCWSHYYHSLPNYCESTWAGWVIRCIPWYRRYFWTTMQFSKMIMPPPLHTAGTVQSWFEEH
jgi:hypothetical protein